MTLDESLLTHARTEAEKLAEAERQALVARAEYHTAIRRLHLAGGSLREIAEALGLSHQRVQQMVGGAGGSWWSRAWGSRKVARDAVCTFCGRPPSEVEKLVAGPNVYICDRCIASAERALDGRADRGLAQATNAMARCSFCRKRGRIGRESGRGVTRTVGNRAFRIGIVASANARICDECLATSREIIDGRTTQPRL